MNESHHTRNIIGALLAGAAIGAVLGILFAPEKGSETRKKYSDKGEDLVADLEKLLSEFLKHKKDMKEESGKEESDSSKSDHS